MTNLWPRLEDGTGQTISKSNSDALILAQIGIGAELKLELLNLITSLPLGFSAFLLTLLD